FLLALCRLATPADGPPEPVDLRPALRPPAARGPHRTARPRPADRAPARSPGRQIVLRPEDPGRARQGALERAGAALARRADRLARPRQRRLGARLSRRLPRTHRRHDPPRLAQ